MIQQKIKDGYIGENIGKVSYLPGCNECSVENSLHRGEVNIVDDNKILEKYLEKVDQDRRDMEQRLSEERRESEKRIEEQRKLSEERMEKQYLEVIKSIKETSSDINAKVERIENKVGNTTMWIIGLCATTILSIAAMVITIIVTK